jgi:hypothetical protein
MVTHFKRNSSLSSAFLKWTSVLGRSIFLHMLAAAQGHYLTTSIGQDLGFNDRVKMVCIRIETVDESIPRLGVKQ